MSTGSQASELPIKEGDALANQRRLKVRACKHCRNLKIRCQPCSDRNSCKACHYHGLNCVPADPARPRLKTSQKIASLEEKLEYLSGALENQRSPQFPFANAHNRFRKAIPDSNREPPSSKLVRDNGTDSPSRENFEAVLIECKLDVDTATILFDHWRLELQHLSPFVDLHNCNDPFALWSTRPALFAALIVAASFCILPVKCLALSEKVTRDLLHQAHIVGNQSLDLVEAFLVLSQYSVVSHGHGQFSLAHHAHTASIMAFDLGFDGCTTSTLGSISTNVAETARAWLASYSTISIATALLNRQRLVFDVSSVESAISALSCSSRNTTSDCQLICMVRLYQIVAESNLSLRETKHLPFENSVAQLSIKQIHQRLDELRSSTCGLFDKVLEEHLYSSVKLYIYRDAILRLVERMDSSQHETGTAKPSILSSFSDVFFGALTICFESSQTVLRQFVSLPISMARNLPIMFHLWTLFAGVSCLKLAPFAESLQFAEHSFEPRNGTKRSAVALFDSVVGKYREIRHHNYAPQTLSFLESFERLKAYYGFRQAICIRSRAKISSKTGASVKNLLGESNSTAARADTSKLNVSAAMFPNSAHSNSSNISRQASSDKLAEMHGPRLVPATTTSGHAADYEQLSNHDMSDTRASGALDNYELLQDDFISSTLDDTTIEQLDQLFADHRDLWLGLLA